MTDTKDKPSRLQKASMGQVHSISEALSLVLEDIDKEIQPYLAAISLTFRMPVGYMICVAPVQGDPTTGPNIRAKSAEPGTPLMMAKHAGCVSLPEHGITMTPAMEQRVQKILGAAADGADRELVAACGQEMGKTMTIDLRQPQPSKAQH